MENLERTKDRDMVTISCDSEVNENEIDFQNCATVLKSYVIPGDLGKPVNVTLQMSGKPEVEFDRLITLDTTGQCSMA